MATILIVDDLSANRRVLATLLGRNGHRMLEAVDGSDGLAKARSGHPDLVITDVLMPVMDGYELAKQLRLEPATAATPIIFYSAHYGEREARALALSTGVADVLQKPAESAEVLRIVARALAGELEKAEPPTSSGPAAAFDREHLRLITDKLSETVGELRTANSRLRALINIGLELSSEKDPAKLLQSVCVAAHDVFGATYVTLGLVDLKDRTVERVITCGQHDASWIRPGDPVPGILGTVVEERRTLRGQNAGGDPVAARFPAGHPEVQAFLVAPLSSPEHVFGWFCLVGNEGTAFTADDEYLVLALAGQIGRVYETRHFHALAEARTRDLEDEVRERKEAEVDLREERDRSRRYLDTAEVILLALDAQGRISLVNRYACSIFGWTEKELLGRDFIETCIPTRMRDEIRARLASVLAGSDTSIVENAIVTKSGEERLIEWRNTLLRDDAGRVVSTLSSGSDLTERNRVTETLRATEERMRFALEAAGVGIWDQDFTTGSLRWSTILESQYGLSPGTFGGTFEAFTACIHPADRASVLETVGRAMKTGADFSVLNRSNPPDGKPRWLSGAGRILLDEGGNPVRGLGISMDVTDQRALEEQYRQAQKMEAIGRLAGGVAHDFNNLLTVILGNCELLLSNLPPGDSRHADLTEIRNAGERAAGLTRQLLAFSRKQIIEPTVLDLNAVATDMRPMLERLIGEDVKVLMVLQPGLHRVKADRGQAEQIVLNLSLNARDAMPGGGTLTIETADVELDENYPKTHLAATPGRYVSLTVSDTGTGMTPEVQARLFEPFFTTKEVGKGTGLGLATIHGIVMRNGGSINVYSEVGTGTSIKVYLPESSEAETPAEGPTQEAKRLTGAETVLVVEDEESLRDLVKKLLVRQGYTVRVAANADEAFRVMDDGPIDVLLTDVVMPGASGPELTRKLIEKRPGLKVVYMSGYTEEAIVHRGVLEPGVSFLHKPFTSKALVREIRQALDR